MKKVIFDCDNTMGLYGKDVDDGLALMYLLGRDDVNLLGVTTTFGNSTIDEVYPNTVKMFHELGISHIPLKKGAPSVDNRYSQAAEFLAETINTYPGEITLLATGSLTNLYGAFQMDNEFFKKVKEIVLMGGITKPLIIEGKKMNELNFSSDAEATYVVLSSNCKVSVLTGHICLEAKFGEEEFKRLMEDDSIWSYKYIREKSYDWFKYFTNSYYTKEFYNWDTVAAVYVTNPELFEDNTVNVVSTVEDLKKGYLKIDDNSGSGYKVNIPIHIKDRNRFNEIVFEAWSNVPIQHLS